MKTRMVLPPNNDLVANVINKLLLVIQKSLRSGDIGTSPFATAHGGTTAISTRPTDLRYLTAMNTCGV